jgi:signal peptidase I
MSKSGGSRHSRADDRGSKTAAAGTQGSANGRVRTADHWRTVLWEWFKAIAWALAIALLIRQFFFQAFRIPTGSMKETLLIHDYLFANKFLYGAKTPDRLSIPFLDVTLIDHIPHLKFPAIRQPRQGDIIVFVYPEDRRTDYIKRCVAVAGDTVLVRDGILRVNGRIYESNFADHGGDHSCIPTWREPGRCPEPHSLLDPISYQLGTSNRQFGPYLVPPDHLFMMGDNRYNSQDSRYWGPLPLDLVKGKAEIIYWSYENTFFIPRWDRLLRIIDLPPSRAWIQPTVRIGFMLLVILSVLYYRRRKHEKAMPAAEE